MTSEIRANTLKNRVGLGTVSFTNTGPVVSGIVTANGLELNSVDAGSSAGPELKLYRNSASPADADYLGQLKFAGESDTGVERNYAKITGKILDASNGTEDGILEFAHIKAGSQTITGRWRSDSLQLLNSTNFSVAGTSSFTGDMDIADKIVHTGDTNTAIRFPSNDTITFETAGSEKLRIASNGNIKIGSGAPALAVGSGLEIDTGGAATLRLEDSGSGSSFEIQNTGGSIKQRMYNSQPWVVEHGSGEKFRITSDGKVGINRTTPVAPITARRTDAGGTGTNGVIAEFANSSGYGVWFGQSSASGASWGATTGAFYWNTGGLSSQVERLRIASDGKIGMGLVSTSASNTCDPDGNQLLIRGASTVGTAKGHIMLTGDSATVGQGPQIVFSESGSGSNNAGAYIGHIRQGSNSIGDLVFGTRATSGDANTVPTERLRIKSDGKVGIGTNSPQKLLELQHVTNRKLQFSYDDNIITIKGANNNGNPETIRLIGGNSIRFHTGATGSGTEQVRIDSNGDLNLGNNPTNQYGYKLNIQDSAIIYAQTASSGGLEAKWHLDNSAQLMTFGTVSTDDLSFVTTNVPRLTIKSNGNIGVNNDNPQRILHVGKSGTAEANIRIQGGSDYGEIRVKDSDNELSFHHNVGGAGSRELFSSNGSTGHFSINCYSYQALTITTNENGANGPEIQLMHNSASPAASDIVGQLRFSGKDSAGDTTLYSKIQTKVLNTTNGSEAGHIDFSTRGGGAYNSIFRLNARSTASAPNYTTDDMNGIILDTYNTGNPYPRYFNFIGKSAGNTASNIAFWTEDVGGSPTEKVRLTNQGNIVFRDNDSGHIGGGVYTRTKTVTTSGDATSSFMRFSLDHGAIAGMIFLTGSNSGYSVAKTYAFVAQYGQTVTTNLLADTGAYSGANISFTSSTNNNQHNFMVQVSGVTQEVNMTVILGNANQNVTYTELA